MCLKSRAKSHERLIRSLAVLLYVYHEILCDAARYPSTQFVYSSHSIQEPNSLLSVLSIISIVCEAYHVLCTSEGLLHPEFAYLYISIVDFISISCVSDPSFPLVSANRFSKSNAIRSYNLLRNCRRRTEGQTAALQVHVHKAYRHAFVLSRYHGILS